MCQRCAELLRQYVPEVPDAEGGGFLMGSTSFPFGKPEHLEPQLAFIRSEMDRSGLDWRVGYAIADASLDRFREGKERQAYRRGQRRARAGLPLSPRGGLHYREGHFDESWRLAKERAS